VISARVARADRGTRSRGRAGGLTQGTWART